MDRKLARFNERCSIRMSQKQSKLTAVVQPPKNMYLTAWLCNIFSNRPNRRILQTGMWYMQRPGCHPHQYSNRLRIRRIHSSTLPAVFLAYFSSFFLFLFRQNCDFSFCDSPYYTPLPQAIFSHLGHWHTTFPDASFV